MLKQLDSLVTKRVPDWPLLPLRAVYFNFLNFCNVLRPHFLNIFTVSESVQWQKPTVWEKGARAHSNSPTWNPTRTRHADQTFRDSVPYKVFSIFFNRAARNLKTNQSKVLSTWPICDQLSTNFCQSRWHSEVCEDIIDTNDAIQSFRCHRLTLASRD